MFCQKHDTDTDIYIYIYISTHPYEYIYVQSITMNTSEKLSRLDLEIHKIGYQEQLAVNRDVKS
jgi:hypothetical protein